jgi:HSP20 family protein
MQININKSKTSNMTFLRFYNPVSPYRDENANDAYDKIIRRFSTGTNEGKVPASNILENEKEFRIEMALPGIDKKNIRLMQEKGYLTISVEKTPEKQDEEKYSHFEFNYSEAARTFRTGDKIDTENITAQYENGILTVRLPKKEAFVKAAKMIEVE